MIGAGGAGHRLAVVLDPRFPGGTAASVAEELRALHGSVTLSIYGLETAMFSGRPVNPRLEATLEALGLPLTWNPTVIRGDSVAVHNPACLKFETALAPRISAGTLHVVCHENFLRPNGSEGFDVGHCLELLRSVSVAGRLVLAPISAGNRRGVEAWCRRCAPAGWAIAERDWPSICDFPFVRPTSAPRDRRGRHSRPGLEKFPPMEVMLAHFPAHAEHCAILGADAFLGEAARLPRHWKALPFGAVDVWRFLEEIDFFVYFTHPLWRESFGRAIAEAIAAGKLVITDAATAESFGRGVVVAEPGEVDAVIRAMIAAPDRYAALVREAQAGLVRFRPETVRATILDQLGVRVAVPSVPARQRAGTHARL